jgi:uncharacterized surface protein with fasciclin (FAS1) repeats
MPINHKLLEPGPRSQLLADSHAAGTVGQSPRGAHDTERGVHSHLHVLLRDSAKLEAVLNYHIVSGHYMAKEVKSGEVMTLQGSTLTAAGSSSDLRVNGARVKHADLVATNGVVHGIDVVIVPKNWQLLAAAA